ncbi:MAG: type I phosphomannose isomerase catalytic subunit [Planctomycetota bacterium]|nr:type I phosphomannose isomerase catalytic subunit [Planctomycetota bacterium]
MQPYPIIFEPILKHRVWGGRELARLGKPLPEDEPIGESWELADLPEEIEEGRNVIANGPLTGKTIREAIADHRREIMGAAALTAKGGFPLLIKYLDARRNLSVQVHPTAEYVKRHPEAHLKSEAWVIVEAEPGAVIYKGVRPDVTAEDFAEHIRTDEVVDDLIAVPVKAGDCHYLPSGTCHALGEGIIVAEIQTPSDTTFRVYDWGRTGRELHIEQALECIDFGAEPVGASGAHEPMVVDGLRTSLLVETEYFTIERVETMEPVKLPVVTDEMPVTWMVISGAGRLRGGEVELALSPGVTALLPAALEDGTGELDRGCSLLRVSLPSPTRGMIA